MSYRYISPESMGYEKISVTRKQHNAIFPNRKVRLAGKIEWYYNRDKQILKTQHFTRIWCKVLVILVAGIPSLIWQGFPETAKDVKGLIFERRDGHFSEDTLFVGLDNKKLLPAELYKILKI